MAFVDDVKQSFDASDFCEIVRAGVGDGKFASSKALRDSAAVSIAIFELKEFVRLASSPDGPDVVASYVAYSPGAAELFNALRAVSVNTVLVCTALDCLETIVKYSLDRPKSGNALDGARSVVKEIAKTRAALLQNIFVNDKRDCAKKVLSLLRLVAMCHPLLAKEIVNRFDLSSEGMAFSLCNLRNHVCRVPFLNLITALLERSEQGVQRYLATKGRDILIICIRVITDKTVREAEGMERRPIDSAENGGDAGPAQKHRIQPSYIQRQELHAAINFLLAIEKHVLVGHHDRIRRTAFSYPLMHMLATLSSTDMPPRTIAPREVEDEHTALRATALRIFSTIAQDSGLSSINQIADALNATSIGRGSAASVKFVLSIVCSNPRIACRLLETGPYLTAKPALNSKWLAHMSIVSACVVRLSQATPLFRERGFFEHCFSHEASLVRHFGSLLLLAICKLIRKDPVARSEPHKYLPPLGAMRSFKEGPHLSDEVGQKILASYQLLFSKDIKEAGIELMTLALDSASNDLSVAEDSVRAGLMVTPRESLHTLLCKGYLSRLLMQVERTSSKLTAGRVWLLCNDILKATRLFPEGTEKEVDFFLMALSVVEKEKEGVVGAFENMVRMAWQQPYGLCNDLNMDSHGGKDFSFEVSLLTVASLIRLRKLKERNSTSKASNVDLVFDSFLKRTLSGILAHNFVIGGKCIRKSFLASSLSSLLDKRSIWWLDEDSVSKDSVVLVRACHVIQTLLCRNVRNLATGELRLVKNLASYTATVSRRRADPVLCENGLVDLSLAWESRCEVDPTETKVGLCLSSILSHSFLSHLVEFRESLYLRGNFETIKDLKASLSQSDFVLAVCILLRAVVNKPSCRVILVAAGLEEMCKMINGKGGVLELTSMLQGSLLSVCRKSPWLHEEELTGIIDACITRLSVWKAEGDFSYLEFGISMLSALVSHISAGVAIRSRLFLTNSRSMRLPPLYLLSDTCLRDLLVILPNIPGTSEFVLEQLSAWSGKEFSRGLPLVLPVIHYAVKVQQVLDPNVSRSFDGKHFGNEFLEAACSSSANWTSREGCSPRKSLDLLSEIGDAMFSAFGKASVLESIVKHRESVKTSSGSVWLLMGNVFQDTVAWGSTDSTATGTIVRILTCICEWMVCSRVELVDEGFQVTSSVLCGMMRLLAFRGFSAHSAGASSQEFESVVSKMCTVLIGRAQKLKDKLSFNAMDESPEDRHRMLGAFHSVFSCLTESFRLDLNLDRTAKECFSHLLVHNAALVTFVLNNQKQDESCCTGIENDILSDMCELVRALLSRLPRFGLDDEVMALLRDAYSVLGSRLSGFQASTSTSDTSLLSCFNEIRTREKSGSTHGGGSVMINPEGFFSDSAATAISLFESQRLETASDIVLEANPCTTIHPAKTDYARGFHSASHAPLNATFALQVFLRACSEALETPESPVLDIGKIATDGFLGLAISGLASPESSFRALSYACVDLFAQVVGPAKGVPLGSAAALYKDRKQLGFLLELLRNSISESMTQVLPIFAVWFRMSLRVALNPGHLSNKIATSLFLRTPVLNPSDCIGVVHYLHCEASGPELKSTRILALDILRRGAHSSKDVLLLGKRKIFDTILMLAGSVNGFDSALRRRAISTIEAIIAREENLQTGGKLVTLHGLIPWLSQCIQHLNPRPEEIYERLNLLRLLAEISRKENRSDLAIPLANALSNLVKLGIDKTSATHSIIVSCGAAICRVSPTRRRLLHEDLSFIFSETGNLEIWRRGIEELNPKELAVYISRQRNVNVPDEACSFVLGESLKYGGNREIRENQKTDSMMIDIFVVNCLLQKRQQKRKSYIINPELCESLALALETRRSVWLMLASLCAAELCNPLSEELLKVADALPTCPPEDVDASFESRFKGVVSRYSPILVKHLLSYASERHMN